MGREIALKRILVGTAVGRAAMAIRDRLRLWRAPHIETGMMVNDQIAQRLVVAFCPAHGTFVDAGAHIGSVISEVQFRHPLATIVAFEPIPDKADALRRKFPTVAVHDVALWHSEGEVSFFVDDVHSSCSSLHQATGTREIKVPTRRLAEVLRGVQVDVLKIDVEGAELGVLRGASDILRTSRPIVMFESGPQVLFDFTKQEMFAFFADHEYALFAPSRIAHTGAAMTLDSFLDSHEYPRWTTNYFALPAERASAIRSQARTLRI